MSCEAPAPDDDSDAYSEDGAEADIPTKVENGPESVIRGKDTPRNSMDQSGKAIPGGAAQPCATARGGLSSGKGRYHAETMIFYMIFAIRVLTDRRFNTVHSS